MVLPAPTLLTLRLRPCTVVDTLCEDCIVGGVVSDTWVHGLLRRHLRPAAATA